MRESFIPMLNRGWYLFHFSTHALEEDYFSPHWLPSLGWVIIALQCQREALQRAHSSYTQSDKPRGNGASQRTSKETVKRHAFLIRPSLSSLALPYLLILSIDSLCNRPKHPLSAYNLYFQAERARLMARGDGHAPGSMDKVEWMTQVNGAEVQATATNTRVTQSLNLPASTPDGTKAKLGFGNLARFVAARWKTLDNATKSVYEERSQLDKDRYKQELSEWKKKQEREQRATNDVEATTTFIVETMTTAAEVAGTQRCRAATPMGWSLSTLDSMDAPKLVTPEKKTGFLGNGPANNTLLEGKSLYGEASTNQSAGGEPSSGSSMNGLLVSDLLSARTPVSRCPQLALDSILSERRLHFPMDMTFSTNTARTQETLSEPTTLLSPAMEFPYTSRLYSTLSSTIVSRLALSTESQHNKECPGEHHFGMYSTVPNQASSGPSSMKKLFQFYPIGEFDVGDQFDCTEDLQGVSSTAAEPDQVYKRVSLASGANSYSTATTDDENELLLLDPRVGMSSPCLSVENFEGLE
jgi:hypothetical protein